jgi:DNA polymerase-3 subunit epsilon
MREIVFDTETTGLSFNGGHRLVEIGCVELINRVPTGRHYHVYLNPGRDMPAEAFAVHGLSEAFLSDKPRFGDVCGELIGELGACGRALLNVERIVCTLQMARAKHPGAKHTLDALCVRYGIDLSARELHGALLDAQLLAQVFIELTGGRQITLGLAVEQASASDRPEWVAAKNHVRPPRIFVPSEAELARHRAFMAGFEEPLWGVAAAS